MQDNASNFLLKLQFFQKISEVENMINVAYTSLPGNEKL